VVIIHKYVKCIIYQNVYAYRNDHLHGLQKFKHIFKVYLGLGQTSRDLTMNTSFDEIYFVKKYISWLIIVLMHTYKEI